MSCKLFACCNFRTHEVSSSQIAHVNPLHTWDVGIIEAWFFFKFASRDLWMRISMLWIASTLEIFLKQPYFLSLHCCCWSLHWYINSYTIKVVWVWRNPEYWWLEKRPFLQEVKIAQILARLLPTYSTNGDGSTLHFFDSTSGVKLHSYNKHTGLTQCPSPQPHKRKPMKNITTLLTWWACPLVA